MKTGMNSCASSTMNESNISHDSQTIIYVDCLSSNTPHHLR